MYSSVANYLDAEKINNKTQRATSSYIPILYVVVFECLVIKNFKSHYKSIHSVHSFRVSAAQKCTRELKV